MKTYRYFVSFFLTKFPEWNFANITIDYTGDITTQKDLEIITSGIENKLEGKNKGMKVIILNYQPMDIVKE